MSFVLYFFVALFVMRGILGSMGTVGLFHDWFVGPFPEMISKYSYDGLQLFDMNLGNKVYPSDWLFRIMMIPFASLGGDIISKGMLVFFTTLSGFSMFCFVKTLKLGYFSSFMAGLIYIFSPIVFTRAVAGYVYYLLGYSLTPFLLATFVKAQRNKREHLMYSIISGLIFGLVGTQIQFFIMSFAILLMLVLIDYRKLKKGLLFLTITTVIGSVLHFPWILPLILTPSAASPSTQTFLAYHEITSSPTLIESIRVIGYKIHPYSYTQLIKQDMMPNWILYTNFLMPIMASFALLLKRDKYTIGFAAIAILGIFLSKGINPPLEGLFILTFKYTPLVIFRELWHIAFLTFFSYTVLTSIAFHEITKKTRLKIGQVKNYALATSLVTIVIVSNGYPLFLGNFASYMQTYSLSEDYQNLFQSFQKDQDYYRILWLPSITPMKYENKSLFGVDPLISFSPKPTFPQHILSQYPLSRLTMFLISTIQENRTQQFGNIITPFATQYIIQRNDFTSKYPLYVPLGLYTDLRKKWEPDVTNNFIANQQDLRLENETLEFKLNRNTNLSEFIYTPTTVVYGTKDISTLTHLAKISNLTEIAYLTDTKQLETSNPIFIIKNDGFDLTPIITGEKIDPGNYVTETDAQEGWVNSKDWFWYNYLFASTINSGAFSKTNSQLKMPIETKADSEIWAKILKWQNGGKLEFTLSKGQENTITTLSNAFALEWTKLYDENSTQTHTLTISNIDGENYIDEILILNKQQNPRVASKLDNATIVYLIDPTSFDTNLVRNPSFEETKDGYPLYWSNPKAGFTAVSEKLTANQGNLSLKVTTHVNSTWRWSWIRSSEIPVKSGGYQIITHVKQENNQASHIAIEGLNKATDRWIQLIQVPAGQDGSYDWRTYKIPLTVNKSITMLRIALNAGWVLDEAEGNATTWFDNISIIPQQKYPNEILINVNASATKSLKILREANYRIAAEILGTAEITVANQTFNANSTKYEMVNVGSVFLRNGNHEVKIKALENTQIGALWVYTSPQNRTIEEVLQNAGHAKIVEYKQENPALWKARVNASAPFLLTFAAPYDSQWCAYVSNKKHQPIPFYGFINGFNINQTGLLEVVIEYEPQRWFNYGSIMSFTTLLACLTYLTYNWTKNKSILKRTRNSLTKILERGSVNRKPNT